LSTSFLLAIAAWLIKPGTFGKQFIKITAKIILPQASSLRKHFLIN